MTTGGDIQREITYRVKQLTTAKPDKLEAVQERFRAELELQFGSSVVVEVVAVFEEFKPQHWRRTDLAAPRRRT